MRHVGARAWEVAQVAQEQQGAAMEGAERLVEGRRGMAAEEGERERRVGEGCLAKAGRVAKMEGSMD